MFFSSTSVNSKILNKNAVVYIMIDFFVVVLFRFGYFRKKKNRLHLACLGVLIFNLIVYF